MELFQGPSHIEAMKKDTGRRYRQLGTLLEKLKILQLQQKSHIRDKVTALDSFQLLSGGWIPRTSRGRLLELLLLKEPLMTGIHPFVHDSLVQIEFSQERMQQM